MGLVFLKIEVGNPANPDYTETVEFLVDSGAIYSVVPSTILKGLNIQPLAEEEYRLANGEFITRKKGYALFRHQGKVGVADAIFGEEGDANILGATTLEALGLTLDPLKRELKPLPLLLAQLVNTKD